ncbi:MAG: exodeoxyribonuclease VII large subunit [Vulcanimicrobiaceae bacterium]
MTPSQSRVPSRVVTVKRLADYLKRKVEADQHLRDVSVRGEISNLRTTPSGNVNFDLKEDQVVIAAFAWASDAVRFPGVKNGLAVIVRGAVTTWDVKSTYQIVVRAIELEGIGDVQALFDARKKQLQAEGLFAAERKRPLPAFPFRVALVSSRSANGAIDFVTILKARAPHVGVVWCETLVQGPNAPGDICAALARASRADVDCIVVTRGGGSFEDLFTFSDERVVRAIAGAAHPVISAIGHTADQQLCDFAADVHVETPSAAARAVGPDLRVVQTRVDDAVRRGCRAHELRLERFAGRLQAALLRSKLADTRVFFAPLAQRVDATAAALANAAAAAVRKREDRVRGLARRLDAHDPSRRLAERARRLQAATLGLEGAARAGLDRSRRNVAAAATRLDPAARAIGARAAQALALAHAHLDGKNPEAILQRGYAIVTYRGAVLSDPASVAAGERIEARLARGTLSARVERKETDGN